jgi:hypothetical protein
MCGEVCTGSEFFERRDSISEELFDGSSSNMIFLPLSNALFTTVQTIGAEFNVKQVTIPDTNVVVEIFLYDCAGQSIFNQLDLNTKYVRRVANQSVQSYTLF